MKKVIYIILFTLISIGGVGGIYLYKIFYESNTLFDEEYVFVKIPTNSTENQLLDSIWGNNVYVEQRTVDVHIGRLRKALNRSKDIDPIRTVHGTGYSLDETYKKK